VIPRLGARGEGWVALQGVLLVLLAAAGVFGSGWPAGARPWLAIAAVVLAFAGGALGLGGAVALGRQLTPFPRPVERGGVRERGVYALVRHPIYGGVLLATTAWALATSPLALIPVAALAAVLEAKRRVEEAWLIERYPEYAEYRRRVRWRFVPGAW
jgi:protein-S-isoprenylcysteine O-methyltransferase Ste14